MNKLYLFFLLILISIKATGNSLGKGVDLRTESVLTEQCVSKKGIFYRNPKEVVFSSNQEHLISQEYHKKSGSIHGSVNLLIFSGSAKIEVNYSYSNVVNSERDYLYKRYIGEGVFITEYELTPEAKSVYSRSIDEFKSRCGTAFVSGEYEVSEQSVYMAMDFDNSYRREFFKTKIKVKGLFGLVKKSKTIINETIEKWGVNNLYIQYYLYSDGEVIPQFLACKARFDICLEKYYDIVSNGILKDEGNQQQSLVFQSYEALGLRLSDTVNLFKLNQVFLAANIQLARLNHIETRLNNCINSDSLSITLVREYISKIIEKQRFCSENRTEDCMFGLASMVEASKRDYSGRCILY